VHFGAGFAGWLAQAADRWPPIDTIIRIGRDAAVR
jgi:hypothetical protein